MFAPRVDLLTATNLSSDALTLIAAYAHVYADLETFEVFSNFQP